MGFYTFSLLRDLLTLYKLSSKDYDSIVQLIKVYLYLKPSASAKLFKFSQRQQQESEAVVLYAASLKTAYLLLL